ncbi:uncharacterized protein BDR25DRAFT_311522 [Lindgomyces ingoldianus]|uniref:Uncharacterized protein n=1 Tax=Lindgomyces ingoldianus TaxID=673940 RepID=A0ACB6R6I6_9PLEO|nr:uncharacterized protein BDR25DRAFT_311522 [Lindgomyces ingoldianus]KAF2474132.1 hypothetical protein BDR25DRAFT_311522 [Lindgomyces ingoldianus]
MGFSSHSPRIFARLPHIGRTSLQTEAVQKSAIVEPSAGYTASMGTFDFLSQLPGELVDDICANLEIKDIHSFRLTCKMLHKKSYRQFAVCHFRIAQFMITRESLQALRDISKDERFRAHIKEIQLCLITFPTSKLDQVDSNPLTAEEKDREVYIKSQPKGEAVSEMKINLAEFRKQLKRRRRRLYGRHMHSQHTIRKRGIDIELLSEALRNLPKLESFTILEHLDREYPPWGCRKIRDDIGFWPLTGSMSQSQSSDWITPWQLDYDLLRRHCLNFCSHALSLALGAIARSQTRLKGGLRVEGAVYNFIVAQDRSRSRCATPAKTFSQPDIEKLKPAFSELTDLSIKSYGYYREDLLLTGHNTPFSWLPKFIPLWQSVKNFEFRGAGLAGEAQVFNMLAESKDCFPRMQSLLLRTTYFQVSALIKVVMNHAGTLQYLSIHACDPIHGEFPHLLHGLVGDFALISLKLVNDRRVASWIRNNHNQTQLLTGLGTSFLRIQEGTPTAFQLRLESTLAAIRNG